MPAFYVTLLAGTTGRHPVKAVQPNVCTKVPNPEHERLWKAVDCSCNDIGVYNNEQRTTVRHAVAVGASTMHLGSSGSLQC